MAIAASTGVRLNKQVAATNYREKYMSELKSALYDLDKDSDGRLTIEELQALLEGSRNSGELLQMNETQRKVLEMFDNLVHLRSEANIELNFPPNFEGLVLGCIDADFCK